MSGFWANVADGPGPLHALASRTRNAGPFRRLQWPAIVAVSLPLFASSLTALATPTPTPAFFELCVYPNHGCCQLATSCFDILGGITAGQCFEDGGLRVCDSAWMVACNTTTGTCEAIPTVTQTPPLTGSETTPTPTPGDGCAKACDNRPCTPPPCQDGSMRIGTCSLLRDDGCHCIGFECPSACGSSVDPVVSPWGALTQTITGRIFEYYREITVTGGASPVTAKGPQEVFAIEVPLNPGVNELTLDILGINGPPCHSIVRRDSQGNLLDIFVILPTPSATPTPISTSTSTPTATLVPTETATPRPTATRGPHGGGGCSVVPFMSGETAGWWLLLGIILLRRRRQG
jgi:hypothetical protein